VRSAKLGPITVGKVGYAVACMASAITLVVAGYAHEVVGLTEGLGYGVALGNSPSSGPMNILVMGLESRTTFQGQDLSAMQLTETHSGNEADLEAGDEGEGSQDTDTLILIHIFADGQKAVGYSIPRDDVVNYPHEVTVPTASGPVTLTEGKVDAAYYYAYEQSLGSHPGNYTLANQAGQLFEVQTVESVTGVHIDHFIVSNIIGFYELAQQLHGLEVCIQAAPASEEKGNGLGYGANLNDYDPVTDLPSEKATNGNSGFNAIADGYNAKKGGKQYLLLSPAQSLAYVRSRDTLPGVDIGRTARQQAAIEYIIWKMKTDGVLSDLTAIPTLLNNAKSWLMYDNNWNLIEFAQDMRALSGSHLNFTTLPEISTNNVNIPGYPGAQSANYIDVPQIQQQVNEAFYGSPMIPSTASQVTVDVYNGSGTDGLAGDVSQDLTGMGYKAGAVADSSSQSQPVGNDTEIFYGGGSAAEANAQVIANVMGAQDVGDQVITPLSSLPTGHVEVLLGSQVTAQAPGLEMLGADSVNASDYVSAAQQNGQSVAANVQAAANAGSQSDVPAYSHTQSTPSASSSSGSSGSSSKPGSAPKKSSSTSAKKKPASTSSSSNSNPPYDGLTTCPY
jgi:anionic cell wall polymer biosynthesis LytR-Cps2A-Psr (LCP) family protein